MTEDDYNKIVELIQRDRRVCERLNVDLDVFYSLDLSLEVNSPSWKGPCKLDNIGGEGISFNCSEELPAGVKVSFKFTLTRQSVPMIATGRIIWKGKLAKRKQEELEKDIFAYGIKFDKIKEEFERHFISFISEAIMDKYLDQDGKLKADN